MHLKCQKTIYIDLYRYWLYLTIGRIIDLWVTYKTYFHWYTKQSLVILLKISKRYLIISVLCIHTPKNYLNGFLLRDFENQRLSAISNGFHFPYTLQISLQKMLKDLSLSFTDCTIPKALFIKSPNFVVSSYTIVGFFIYPKNW